MTDARTTGIVGSGSNEKVKEQNVTHGSLTQQEGPTALQLGIMMLVLGSSAGLTLYTKKTGTMLKAMNQVTENQLRNRPPKFGPPTRQEWEKLRPRFDKDEFF